MMALMNLAKRQNWVEVMVDLKQNVDEYDSVLVPNVKNASLSLYSMTRPKKRKQLVRDMVKGHSARLGNHVCQRLCFT